MFGELSTAQIEEVLTQEYIGRIGCQAQGRICCNTALAQHNLVDAPRVDANIQRQSALAHIQGFQKLLK